MTTPAADALYLAQHNFEHEGLRNAVYNPHERDPKDLPVIYGFNNGGSHDTLSAVLLAEDGTGLGSHCCSHEGYMPSDLGILEGTAPYRHETFREHYPDGYRMEFVPLDAVREGHAGLDAAYEKNQAMKEES